jgi:tetratricopeptide (TPR) repeat protein
MQGMLILAIAIELAIGGYLATQRLSRPVPPLADQAELDSTSSEDLRTLVVNCKTADQWRQLGEAYLALGFYPEAEACLRQATATDPNNADLAFKHAFALERIGKLEDANRQFEVAAKRNHPRRADCWYYIGRNYLRVEQPERAAEAFKRTETLPAARYELALLAARSGLASEAEEIAGQLTRDIPESYTPVSLQYRLALRREDWRRADALAEEFQRRPRPLPSPFDTEVDWVFDTANSIGRDRLFRDAGREMQAGRVSSAEQLLGESLQAAWHPDVADRLAEVRFMLGRPDEAMQLLSEAIDRAGPTYRLLWRLGQVHAARGNSGQTAELWERASRLATGPEARGLWQDLAAYYERAGDAERATTYSVKAGLAEGRQLLNEGQPSAAVTALMRVVNTNPDSPGAWFYLGQAHQALGHVAEARTAYQKCLAIDPDWGRASRAMKLFGE